MQPLPREEDPSESMILQTSSGIEPFVFLHISMERKGEKFIDEKYSNKATDISSRETSLKIDRNIIEEWTELSNNPTYLLVYGMQHKLDCCAKNSQLVTAYLSVKIKGEII